MLCKKMHISYFALQYISASRDKVFARIYANYGNSCKGNNCKPVIWFYPIDKRKKDFSFMTLTFSRNEIKDEYFKYLESKDAKRFIAKTLLEKVKDHDICIENTKNVFS